jgi:hypothetical protein
MLCDRCREAEATQHFSEITETSIRAGELCRRCYLLELGPVPLDEARAWMTAFPPGTFDFSSPVLEWSERAQLHAQSLPQDVQTFIERHRSRPSV